MDDGYDSDEGAWRAQTAVLSENEEEEEGSDEDEEEMDWFTFLAAARPFRNVLSEAQLAQVQAEAEALLARPAASRAWGLREREFGSKLHRKEFLADTHFLQRLQPSETLRGHHGCVNTLEWRGQTLVSGSDDTSVKLWRAGQNVATVRPGHRANVFSASFLTDSLVASCDRSGFVCVSDMERQLPVETYGCNFLQQSVKRIATRDENVFFCCTDAGDILRYDVRTRHNCVGGRECQARQFACHGFLYTIAYSRREQAVFSGGFDELVRVFDERFPLNAPSEIDGGNQMSHITGLALSSNDEQLVVSYGGHASVMMLFDCQTRQKRTEFLGHINEATVKGCRFGAHDRVVMGGSDDGNAFVWDAQTGKCLSVFEGDSSITNCVAMQEDDLIVATSGLDADIRLHYPTATHDRREEMVSILSTNLRTSRWHARLMDRLWRQGPGNGA